MTYRMTLIAGAIVALAGMPAWAQTTGSTTGAAGSSGAAAQSEQTTPRGTSDSRSTTGAGQSDRGQGASSLTPGAQMNENRQGASTTGPSSATRAGQSDRAQGASGQTPSAQMGGSSATSQSASASSQAGSNPIYRQSADHLKGMEVVDLNGEEVGSVDRVVLAPDRKKAHVVISSGGLLGVGATERLVSIDDLRMVDGNLQMRHSKQAFESTAKHDDSSQQYTELRGDDPIQGSLVEFSAFEPERDAGTRGATPGTSTPGASPSGVAPGGATPGSTPGAMPGGSTPGGATPGESRTAPR